MKRNSASIFILRHLFGLFAVAGIVFAVAADEKTEGTKTSKLTIAAGDMEEVCMTLAPKEKLRYAFAASDKLSFSIHYHAGDQIVFPIPEHLISEAKDSFTPVSRQDYCLMWTNPGPEPVELRLEYDNRVGAE